MKCIIEDSLHLLTFEILGQFTKFYKNCVKEAYLQVGKNLKPDRLNKFKDKRANLIESLI